MDQETKSKIYSWILWIVILAGLGYCVNVGIDTFDQNKAKRQKAQNEEKSKIAAMEQTVLAKEKELLNTYQAIKFNKEEFKNLYPKFSLNVSDFFKDNYSGNILFEGTLQDIALEEEKYLVEVGVSYFSSIGKLDIFVVCKKNIVEKISFETSEKHYHGNEVYLVSNIASVKGIPLQNDSNRRRNTRKRGGNFIAEGTCVDLVPKPSENVDPIESKVKKNAPSKNHEQSNLPDNSFNSIKIIEESYGKDVRIFENTEGLAPSFELEEKIAFELLNKIVKSPGPVKEAIDSIHQDPELGRLNIPRSLTLITFGRDGVYYARKTNRAILTWEEPGTGLTTYPIMEIDIGQNTALQSVTSHEGGEENIGNYILTTEIIGVRKCAEDTLICDVPIPIHSRVPKSFDCDSSFSPNATAQSLAEHFGPENVVSTDIGVGEGEFEKGTVIIDPSGNDEVEITWKDAENQRMPRIVSIGGLHSNWKTRKGLSLGDDLIAVERINRKPFRLFGFTWDGSGMLVSWSGGVLERKESANCHVNVHFTESSSSDSKWVQQVQGDRGYSSGHPAMQALNPRINRIELVYLKNLR